MATIDLKLKTYDELQFEIMNLTTKNYLQQQELDKYKNIVDELEKYLKHTSSGIITENAGIVGVNATANVLQKLKELKGE